MLLHNLQLVDILQYLLYLLVVTLLSIARVSSVKESISIYKTNVNALEFTDIIICWYMHYLDGVPTAARIIVIICIINVMYFINY